MRSLQSQNRIIELLAGFVAHIKGASSLGRTDINRIAETFLTVLLAEVYDYRYLENLNYTDEANYPGIDLGDSVARVAIQVTATANSKKVKYTIQQFIAHNFYEQYDRLVIFILTEKQRSYKQKTLDNVVQNKFNFDPKQDIIDYKDIIRTVSGFQIDRVAKIERILEDNLSPKRDFYEYHMLFRGTPIEFAQLLDDRYWTHTQYIFRYWDFRSARDEPLRAIIAEAFQGEPLILGSLHVIPQAHNRTIIVGQPEGAQAYDDDLVAIVPQLERNPSFERAWSILRASLMTQDLLLR